MEQAEKIPDMVPKHDILKLRLTDAIIDLCRKEAFYIEELRIEGTVCLVSDRTSVLVAQITEQIGHQGGAEDTRAQDLLHLNKDQASHSNQQETRINIVRNIEARKENEDPSYKVQSQSPLIKKASRHRYNCPFCPKSYPFKHGLRDHINIHTGRKPHVCKFCLLSFSHLGSMCGHMKREHCQQLSGTRVCCSCHTQSHTGVVSHQVNWGQNIGGRSHCPSQPPTENEIENKPKQDKPMETERIPFAPDTLDNLKRELEDPPGDGRDAMMGEKDGESIMDVRNFLRQFENEKDENSHQNDHLHHQAGPRANEGPVQPLSGLTGPITPDLIQALAMSQAGQGSGRWDNTALTAVTLMNMNQNSPAVTAPQTQPLPGPTLEMLAHMAQMAQGPQFPAISELSQVLTAQQRATASGPRLRMPSPQSLQRSADGKFQCPFCEKTYNFKHTLKDHINKHMGNRPHVCKHCGDSFTHLASLCAHIKRRHDSQMTSDYQCELCHEKFMNLQSLKQHFTWRHKDVKFSPQKFLESSRGVVQEGDTSPALTSAGYHSTSSSVTKLPVTNSTMSTSPSLQGSSTLQTSSGLQATMGCTTHPIPPSASSTITSLIPPPSLAQLTSPIQSLTSPTGQLSDQCLYPPESPNDRLQKKPSDEQTITSLNNQPQFPGDFVYPSGAGCHDNSRQEGSVSRQPADEENLSFTTHIADYFSEVNLQTEQGLYKYKCKVCGNLFKIRNSLYEHLNSHLGKKPYVCGTCGDAFTHHSSLHNHTRNKHSQQSRQEREAQFRHICSVCSKKFRFPSELDRHFKTNPDHDIRQTAPSMI